MTTRPGTRTTTDTASRAPVGSLGSPRLARVDGHGGIGVDGSPVTLDWWIGAEDRWHVAGSEPAVRQHRLEAAPVYETAMRIPSGDAIQRVYAIGGPGDPVVVEIENDSPAPVALALVVRGATPGCDLAGVSNRLDRAVQLLETKPASRLVAAANDHQLLAALERGEGSASRALAGAREGPTAGAGVVARLDPLAHRTRARFALVLHRRAPDIDLVAAPGPAAAARGWVAMIRRGMQVVFADAERQLATDRARVDVLLEGGTPTAGAAVFSVLEDWGLDAEAVDVWHRLRWRERRRAARRATASDLPAVQWLRDARAELIGERPDGSIVLAPRPPEPGAALEVHDAPTRAGTIGYAVRWHGRRPVILWDVRSTRGPVRLVCPALDPAWSTDAPAGDALLAPVSPLKSA